MNRGLALLDKKRPEDGTERKIHTTMKEVYSTTVATKWNTKNCVGSVSIPTPDTMKIVCKEEKKTSLFSAAWWNGDVAVEIRSCQNILDLNTASISAILSGIKRGKRFYSVSTVFVQGVWEILRASSTCCTLVVSASRASRPKWAWTNTARSYCTGPVCGVEGFLKVTLLLDNTNLPWTTQCRRHAITTVTRCINIRLIQTLTVLLWIFRISLLEQCTGNMC